MSINSVNISGNLTRDPELRMTSSGMSILSLSVAVNDRVKNASSGEWEDKANFVEVTVFGKRGEGIAPYLAKGGKVAISGRLSYSQWEKDGEKRHALKVIADEIELMSKADRAPSKPADNEDEPF